MFRLFSTKRLFTAIFIAALLLLTFFYRGDYVSTKNNQTTAAVLAPITVVKNTPTLSTDNNGNGVVNPGDILTYTVTVSNGATNATGVIFTDVLDSNLTLVPGSVNSSPIAANDSFNVLGNVSISVPTANGVKINDLDPDGTTATITGFGNSLANANANAPGNAATSANGGNITLNADGSFTYNPPAGFDGADSFFYTLSDGAASDTAQVTLNISGMIWFIRNDASACTTLAAGCGRLSNPFSSLASFASINNGTGNNPAANDNIFIYTGTGSYDASLTLLNNQKLIGQGASATLQSISGVTVPSFSAALPSTGGTNPTLISTTANAVNIASGNTIRGLTVGNTTGSKLNASASVGTLTIGPTSGTSDVTLNGTGRALNLTGGGTLAARFASVSANGGTNGIVLTGMGGNLESPTTTIQNSTGTGISVSNSVTGGTFNFGNTSVSGTAGTGVLLSGNANSLTFAALNITPNSGQRAFHATNNTGTITSTSGTISTTNATVIEITQSLGTTPLNVQLTSISANLNNNATTALILTNISGTGFTVNGTGTTDGSGGTIENILTDAITLNNTDCPVTLKNMIIEDIGSTAGGFNTISGHDAIHGQQVDGGLTLDNLTIQRISDNAINGSLFAGGGATVWNGLSITGGTLIQNTNRFHVAGVGDANNESMVRVLGITGTVNVTDSQFLDGAEMLDLFPTSGTMTLTVTNNNFHRAYKEFTSGTTASVGSHCVDVTVQNSANAVVNIGHRTNNALDNDFLNCRLGSVRVANDAGATGNIDVMIGQNEFTVNDHSSGIGGDFDFPQGGVLIQARGTNTATFDVVLDSNYFDEIANASGGVGQFSLDMDGGQWQVIAEENTFDTPGNAPWFIRADNNGNTGTMNSSILLQNNNYIRAFFNCPDPSCAGGYFGPGLRSLVDVQNGANINFTLNGDDLVHHDTGFDPGQTVEVRQLNVPAGGNNGTVCANFTNNTAADGYSVEKFHAVGTFNIQKGASNSGPCANCTDAQIADVVNDNGNTGGGNNPASVPPFVNVFNTPDGGGAINIVNAACTLPSIPFTSLTDTANSIENDLSLLSAIRQTPAEMLAMLEPLIEHSGKSQIVSGEIITAGSNEVLATESPVLNETKAIDTDFWKTAVAFFAEVSGKISEAISPTVYSQQSVERISSDKQKNQLAGETVCVDGDTNPACSGAGFTIPANESTTITFRATVNANSTATTIPNTANVTANGGINQNSNTVNTTVVQPPSAAKDFVAAFISIGGTTNLNFTITNPNSTNLTGVSLTDVLPTGLSVANSTTSVCGGTNNLVVTAATRTIQLTGATVPANNGTCTFGVTVTGAAEGAQVNVTGNVNSTQGGQGNTATDTVTVINPPTLTKTFTPNQIQLNSTSVLQFTLSNPNTTLALNTLSFTDSLPSGVTAPNTGATTVCTDGSYSITGNVISFSKPSLAAGANCVFSVTVTGTSAGLKMNTTSTVTTSNSNSGTAATANLTVVAPPTIAKSFSPSMILTGGTSTVTLTLSNPNTTGDLTNASFTDNLMNMSAVGGAVGGTCVGTMPNSLSPGATALSFSGITIPNNSSCTVTFDVTSNTVGSHPNTTSGVTTIQTPTAGAASNTVNLSVGNTVTWTGATSINWNVATNWNPASVPTSTNNVLIPSTGVTNEPSILTAQPDVTVGNLEVQTGRTLTIQSGRILTVSGTLTNNGTINNAGSFSFGSLNAGGTVNFMGTAQQMIPAGIYNNITINNAAGVVLGGDVTVNNVLTLTNGNITTNADTLIIGTSGSISRTSGHVIGNLRKDFPVPFNFDETSALSPVFVYPVGTVNGYSPATIDIVSGSGSFTVSATQNFLPGVDQTQSIQRFWSLASNGITEANITFQYLDADVPMTATEANFNFIRRTGMTNLGFAPSSLDTTTNTFTLNGVTQFSDWTLGNLAPTAASVEVGGRVLAASGRGIPNAIVTMTSFNGEIRQTRTSSFGYFRFTDVQVGATYIFSVRHKQFTFSPQVVTVYDEITDLSFVSLPNADNDAREEP